MRMPIRVNTRRTLYAAAALTTLAACSTMSSVFGIGGGMTPSQQAADVNASVRSDADIMGVLHTSNMQEISAGNLASSRASDQAVRDFANMMVRDHSALDRQGASMAQQWGMTMSMPSNQLPNMGQMEMDALTRASNGSQFDRAYLAAQVMDHQRTLAIVDAAIGSARRPELRTMLRDQVRPPVAMHLQMAQNLQGRVGA